MPTLPFIYNGKAIYVPLSWADVTVGQYCELKSAEEVDVTRLLSIFTGIPYEEYLRLSADAETAVLVSALSWFNDGLPKFDELPMPKILNMRGKAVKIPEAIRFEAYGAKLEFDEYVKQGDESGDAMAFIDEILALYLYTGFTGQAFADNSDFTETKAAVRELRIFDAWPVASFFLSNWRKCGKTKTLPSFTGQARRRGKPALSRLIRSGRTTQLKVCAGATLPKLRKSLPCLTTLSSFGYNMTSGSVYIKRT